jgi:hypothetical protein
MEIKKQIKKNRASSHARQGHKISMAIMDRGRSGAIFFRVKDAKTICEKLSVTRNQQKPVGPFLVVCNKRLLSLE